jgi:hypothetical protein
MQNVLDFDSLDQNLLHSTVLNATYFAFRPKIFCISTLLIKNPLDSIEFSVVGRVMQMRLRGVKEHARSSVLAQARTIQGILHVPASNTKYFGCVSHKCKIFCSLTASIGAVLSESQF